MMYRIFYYLHDIYDTKYVLYIPADSKSLELPFGATKKEKKIRIGLKGEAVDRYVDEWIVGMRDVTGLMEEVGRLVSQGKLEEAEEKIPVEEEYVLPAAVAGVIGAEIKGRGTGILYSWTMLRVTDQA
ncbi:hypothetical protein ACJ72_05428 [Emergomyces africanus]|uniref:Uncharacterized protein n=1 Tax=Emergomyces africanus TaxID=1955775 RepID=A0A1B7NTZ4_9EURO|nr:hypothetical protein ACJ72_05428 [Emergomyces africanus]